MEPGFSIAAILRQTWEGRSALDACAVRPNTATKDKNNVGRIDDLEWLLTLRKLSNDFRF